VNKRAKLIGMHKAKAIELLGGSTSAAARRIGITASAVSQWPDELPRAIEDRVIAALARVHLPSALIGGEQESQSAGSAAAEQKARNAA
jgi:transposase-like protein